MMPYDQSRKELSQKMRTETFSARVFDAQHDLSLQRLQGIEHEFNLHGAIHIINSGIHTLEAMLFLMKDIGFPESKQFSSGGRTSATWQPKWAAPGLRNMDYYPADLYLLPNNEIQYRRTFPKRILFFCQKAPDLNAGGRTFLHQANRVLNHVLRQKNGPALIQKLKQSPMIIETGFLDENSTFKQHNYFQSWQERFNTQHKDLGIKRCLELADEYDEAWWHEDTLMTRIAIPLFLKDKSGEEYFRFPRIASDGPSPKNGYRRFLYGDNEELTPEEKTILLRSYFDTREGIEWHPGDFILMDNIRYGHSRESYSGHREILIGMAECLSLDSLHRISFEKPITTHTPLPQAIKPTGHQCERYSLPVNTTMWRENFSARIFNAQGGLTDKRLSEIHHQFNEFGALQVINTGINTSESRANISQELLQSLGFGEKDQFKWGGMICGRTQLRYISKCMRETDDYPPSRVLLPHNEILYQRFMPERLLFLCEYPSKINCGGRTFVHSAKMTENLIRRSGKTGENLLEKIKRYGYLIETGFLDENHPEKFKNYFRSWQERFDTQCPIEALEKCNASKHQFDLCYWHEEKNNFNTLMTRITIPGFKKDHRDGESYLLFPRIALDGPQPQNGYRRYLLGNEQELTKSEITVILEAFWQTREAFSYQSGDLLLVDNLRYGHGRESYEGKRIVSASMAGIFWTDDVSYNNETSKIVCME